MLWFYEVEQGGRGLYDWQTWLDLQKVTLGQTQPPSVSLLRSIVWVCPIPTLILSCHSQSCPLISRVMKTLNFLLLIAIIFLDYLLWIHISNYLDELI